MISVIVPFYNERESVQELYGRIKTVLEKIGQPFEIIFVDDGSTDGTFSEIKKCSPVRGIRLTRNFGQTAAFGAGVANSKGDIVVTMDGDIENQPEDIPLLLKKLGDDFDVVAGWRQNRWKNEFLTRRIPSVLANALISWTTGVKLHDHGCSLRVYRRPVFNGLSFHGEMHRMLAAYLGLNGARIAELPVTYVSRRHGKSKYGLSRTFRVLLDVLAFYFFRTYASRPMHFFGYAGFVSTGLGFLTFLAALYLRLFEGLHFNRTPLPELVVLFVVVGFQFVLMGLLAEILVRGNNGVTSISNYDIRDRIEN